MGRNRLKLKKDQNSIQNYFVVGNLFRFFEFIEIKKATKFYDEIVW